MSAAQPSPAPAAETSFADLGLPTPLVSALAAGGITTAFPIQAQTLPHSLAGRDVLGRGRTGSGKTYAFALPLVARLGASRTGQRSKRPRGLILVPTRELAVQIHAALTPLADAMSLRSTTIFGGVPQGKQVTALRSGVDIVIACPGRLTDLAQQGHADLSGIEITVLDEADHMADLGFLPVVRRLLDRTPANGQRMLFSATLDGGVDVLVKRYLTNPEVHSVDSAQSPVAAMEHHVLHVDSANRLRVITDLAAAPGRTVVFTRTKHGAKGLARKLNASGVRAVELHGNLSQNVRTRNLAAFAAGEDTTLVATDIAARGIHVDDVALVIHADPPAEHKAYLHRSGRTARAGASGTVVTIMLDEQRSDVRTMTRQAGITPVTTRVTPEHPLLTTLAPGERRYGTPIVAPVMTDTATRGRRSAGSSSGQGSRRRSADATGDLGSSSRSAGRRGRTPARSASGGASGRSTSTTVYSSSSHSAATFSSRRGR
jgi:superfamily II DNA/RNA helicase